MKKNLLRNCAVLTASVTLMAAIVTGCGSTDNGAVAGASRNESSADASEAITLTDTDSNESINDVKVSAPFFTKGVYVNYASEAENPTKDYFYVFSDDSYGYTEDGSNGTSVPFDCEQKDDTVTFYFGSTTSNSFTSVFHVKSTDNGVIVGEFDDDGIELVFEPVSDADPDSFSAMNYTNTDNEYVYEDPNGWKVNYLGDKFEITQKDNQVFMVYTGESAGTNMITVTYEVNITAEDAINELAKSWGDNVTVTRSNFPNTEVDGYWATLPPAENGVGMYQTAIARDYMDGCLIFEVTGHNSGDDALDMEVSDALAMIIDSITFINE